MPELDESIQILKKEEGRLSLHAHGEGSESKVSKKFALCQKTAMGQGEQEKEHKSELQPLVKG